VASAAASPSLVHVAEVVAVTVINYKVHEEDTETLEVLRDRLRNERLSRDWTYPQAGAQVGRSENFLYEMENLRSSIKVENLQLWASIYDMRVEFIVRDFWTFAWPSDELSLLYRLSRPFDNHRMQRLWLVSALRRWRERLSVSTLDVGEAMGIKHDSVTQWERTASNPYLGYVMAYARAVGTSVHLQLWKREDWIF
jgi:transcriptional regulator with XRE-family HTH domain